MQDERRLERALARRERAAWSVVYDRHVGELFGLVYHLVGRNRTVAEEIHQEVWLTALEGFDHFDARRGQIRDWLFGIARHRVAHHFRRMAHAPGQDAEDRAQRAADAASPPPEQLEALERGDIVRAALLQLNPDYKDVLVKKYVDGLSVAEISRVNGRSAKAVESLLSRARDRLQELVSPYFSHTNQGDRHEPAGTR